MLHGNVSVKVFSDYSRNSKRFQRIANTTFTQELLQDGGSSEHLSSRASKTKNNLTGELGTSHTMTSPFLYKKTTTLTINA